MNITSFKNIKQQKKSENSIHFIFAICNSSYTPNTEKFIVSAHNIILVYTHKNEEDSLRA